MLLRIEALEMFWTVFSVVMSSDFLITGDDKFGMLVFETREF